MSLLPKNLQSQHIIHHKQGHQHQYILTPLEFQLELLIKDKMYIVLNLI